MKRISILSMLLLVVIAALVVSQLAMMRQLAEARSEVELIRRKYGYIRVDDESKTYVAPIVENEQGVNAYRIRVPSGSRYLLHLSDTTFEDQTTLSDPTPTQTISMNSWREGADVVLSYKTYRENNTPRIVVHTETEELFNYQFPDWVSGAGPGEQNHLIPEPQAKFSTDETIRFMWWRDMTTKRGVMLWLEPYAKWQARQGEARRDRTLP